MSTNRAAKTARRKAKLKASAQHQAEVEMFDFTCGHCGYRNMKATKTQLRNACDRCKWSKHIKAHGDHPVNSGTEMYAPGPCDGMMRPFAVRDYELFAGTQPVDVIYWVCEGCGLSTQYLDCGRYVPIDQDGEEYFPGEDEKPQELRSVLLGGYDDWLAIGRDLMRAGV